MRIEFVKTVKYPPFRDQVIFFPIPVSNSGLGEVQILTGQNGSGKTRLLSCILNAFKRKGDTNEKLSGSIVAFSTPEYFGTSFESESSILCASVEQMNSNKLLELTTRTRLTPSDIQLDLAGSAFSSAKSVWYPHFSQAPIGQNTAVYAFRGTNRVSNHPVEVWKPVQFDKDSSFERKASDDKSLLQSLANLKISAAMDLMKQKPGRDLQVVSSLERVVSQVTGRRFSIAPSLHPEVRFEVEWGDTKMEPNCLPDGLRSIIAWLLGVIVAVENQFPTMKDPFKLPIVLLLDEPESHLHPAWQRKIIPAVQKLLPKSQIFVSTHSPFVISSVNTGFIHVLRIDENGSVAVDKPIPCSAGDSYLDAVEDVLGVSEWYDPETEAMLTEFRELKARAKQEEAAFQAVKELAKEIAKRSEELNSMMAKELKQLTLDLGKGE